MVILLTACVNPNGMSFTKLQDVNEREKQYKLALLWYLKNTNLRIVFVENTMADFSAEFQSYIIDKRLEYITFDGNNYDRTLGKGFGEAMIIDTAIKRSKFIQDSEYILKITGRLILNNINYICKQIHTSDIYSNTTLINGKCMSFSYFVAAPKSFYNDYFLIKSSCLNDSVGYYFEHLLYDSIIDWQRDNRKHHDFKLPLKILGKSGSTNSNYYNGGLMSYLKAYIKYYAHTFNIYRNHITRHES